MYGYCSPLLTHCSPLSAVASYNTAASPAPLFDVFVAGTAADAFVCHAYVWASGDWSECSVDCGVGSKTRTVICTDETGVEVDASLCPPTMPAKTTSCDQGACIWVPSAWSDCSVQCGGGTQLRNLACVNGGGSGLRVLDGNCYSGSSPATTQLCNTAACLPLFWSTQPWSACSVQCGGGKMTRTVGCSSYKVGTVVRAALAIMIVMCQSSSEYHRAASRRRSRLTTARS